MSIFKYPAHFDQVLCRRRGLGMFMGCDYNVMLVGAAKAENENKKNKRRNVLMS